MTESLLLIASEEELPTNRRVWGTGGWLPPEQRDALDWLTLGRLLGWDVSVIPRGCATLEAGISNASHWIVLAPDPKYLEEKIVTLLFNRLESEPLLLVTRADTSGGVLAHLSGVARGTEQVTGRSLRWTGPGNERNWHCRNELEANSLNVSEGTRTWATLEGAPVIVARQIGRGVHATLGFHPSRARDLDGAATALLKHLLIWGSPAPLAWLDSEDSLILRMDDPGGAQSTFSRSWCYPKLSEAQWADIGAELSRRNARLSIGYVSGWVDDGDIERGDLMVDGNAPQRVPGHVYPSQLVMYQDRAGHAPGTVYDGEAEYRGIQSLRAAGLGDVELHGHTHMHPDTVSWAKAPDRFETWPETSWYRELGKAAEAAINARPPHEHPLTLGMSAFQRFFHSSPTTLIAPGDQWTDDALVHALDLGLNLMSSYYLALRDNDRFVWAQHVCAPYLDQPDAAWFVSELPVVASFHDFEVSTEGPAWMSRWLDGWVAAGAKRLIDFREFAGAVCRRLSLENRRGELHLNMSGESAPALVRPVPIFIRVPNSVLPGRLPVSLDRNEMSVEVDRLGSDVGRVMVYWNSHSSP